MCQRKLLFTYPDLSISENFLDDQLSFFHFIAVVSPLLANEVEKDSEEVSASLSTLLFLFDWLEALSEHRCAT